MMEQDSAEDFERLKVLSDQESLIAMAVEVRACNVNHGWFDAERTFGDDIALLHSELSEALEAFRDFGVAHNYRRDDGQFTDEPINVQGNPNKPLGVASELADVLVRLLDTCSRYEVDLFAAWREKMDYNWSRPYRHGGKAL
jgi:hypothetical protein